MRPAQQGLPFIAICDTILFNLIFFFTITGILILNINSDIYFSVEPCNHQITPHPNEPYGVQGTEKPKPTPSTANTPCYSGPYVDKKDMEDKNIVVGNRRIHRRRKRDVTKVKQPSQVVLQLFGPELFKFAKLMGKNKICSLLAYHNIFKVFSHIIFFISHV